MSLTSLTESHVRSQQSHGLTTIGVRPLRLATENRGLRSPLTSLPWRDRELPAEAELVGINAGIGALCQTHPMLSDQRGRGTAAQDRMSPLTSDGARRIVAMGC